MRQNRNIIFQKVAQNLKKFEKCAKRLKESGAKSDNNTEMRQQ